MELNCFYFYGSEHTITEWNVIKLLLILWISETSLLLPQLEPEPKRV